MGCFIASTAHWRSANKHHQTTEGTLINLEFLHLASACWEFSVKLPKRVAALLFIGVCAIPAIASASCPATATSDFAGSCMSDILWQNTGSSQVDIWLMNGTAISSAGSPATPGAGWSVVGVGDFNGDGMADLLWQNITSNEILIWLMNGTTIASSGLPGSPGSDWSVQGVGDFNGDGMADILWQSASTGDVVIWFMNGTSIASSLAVASVPGWMVVGVGDFNGDGMADILWQNQSTGQNVIWLMNGTGIMSSGSPGAPGAPWSVVGVGDFDGDGDADILWQNTATGQLVIWLMNGTSIASSGSPGNPGVTSTPWSVQQVGDFDGDGKADILFYNNATSQVVIWLMNGTSIASSGSPGTPGLVWQVQTPPPYGAPAPAKAVGYTLNTFNSTTLANTIGQLYFPAGFYGNNTGTATQNADGSFTINNGPNLPMIATAHYDRSKPDYWTGECFEGGGYFDTYASWTPYASSDVGSWPEASLFDLLNTAHNAVGPWNQWGTQSIIATSTPTTGATSIGIPAWAGVNNTTMSGVSITDTTGDFAATFGNLFAGETITISGTAGGSGSISGYSSPTTYYVSAVNSSARTFTLETMGQAALTTTAGTLSGLTYTLGLSGTVTFSDSETQLASFTPGATSISWINGLTGSSFTPALSVNWGSNFGDWPEADLFEADYSEATTLGIGGLHNWYAQYGTKAQTHPGFPPVTGIDTSTPHHYSALWVPATASTQGYITFYFDGTVVGTATWDQYNSNTPPAPTGMETNSQLWTGGTAFGVMDARCMMFNWSTGPGTTSPMTIYSFSVWQASASSNQTQ